jgi:hypothetical protein
LSRRFLTWYSAQTASLSRVAAPLADAPMANCSAAYPAPESELFVGKSLALSKIMTDRDTVAFGRVSLDYNPLHFDDALARRTRFPYSAGSRMPGPGGCNGCRSGVQP